MLSKKKKQKIIFLNKMIKLKKNFKTSIIQNREILNINRQKAYFFLNTTQKKKKNCLFSVSNKYIEKKSKFSRFVIKKIGLESLNQNFIKKN